LTGGFADVGSLFDCLNGINWGVADESILDKYSEIRIKVWKEIIDPMSRANFARIWDEKAIPERDKFFALCEKALKDPDLSREMAQVSCSPSDLADRPYHAANKSFLAERTLSAT
jgi:hypothetical protein